GFVDFVEDGDGDLRVGYDAGESLLDVFNGVLGEDAAVDVGGGELGQGVDGVAAFELGGDASGAEYGVPRWGDGSGALEGGFRAAIEAVEGLAGGAGFDAGHLMKIGVGGVVGFEGEAEVGEAGEGSGEVVDGVVGDGERTVAALVVDLEAEADHVLFGDLEVVGDFLAM